MYLRDVGEQFVDPDRASFKRGLAAVAIANVKLCPAASRLHGRAFNLHPVLHDLVDASLNILFVIAFRGQLQNFAKQLGRLRVLMAIHTFANQRLQSLSLQITRRVQSLL